MAETPPKILLRCSEVQEATGFSRSALYSMMSRGEFPRPRKIGSKAIRWLADDVREWAESQPPAAA